MTSSVYRQDDARPERHNAGDLTVVANRKSSGDMAKTRDESNSSEVSNISGHFLSTKYNSSSGRKRTLLRFPSNRSFAYFHEPKIDCSKPNTYIVYVYTGREQIKRRELIRKSWGYLRQYESLDINLKLFFVMGMSGVDTKSNKTARDLDIKLRNEVNKYHDILTCNVIDTYRNLTQKGLAALKWINSTCNLTNLEFIFKTDDDVYVQLWKILRLAKQAIASQSHFLCVLKENGIVMREGRWAIPRYQLPGDRYPRYCLGGGYGMTRKGLALVLDSTDRVTLCPIEDAFFTSLALRWAHPDVNITYYSFHYRNAKMLLIPEEIEALMHRPRKLERFILGHPIPENMWMDLHKTLILKQRSV